MKRYWEWIDAINKITKEDNISRKQLEKELEPWI